MRYKTYTRQEAEAAMQEYISTGLFTVDEVHTKIRKDLEKIFSEVESQNLKNDYSIDILFGIKLYEYLLSRGINNRTASDTGFWRYLSVAVIPHIVEKRWDKIAIDHYWRMPSRIWLSSIWWYVHLAWQGNLDKTLALLQKTSFSTDTILNLVERTGRDGTNVDLYRCIMFYQGKIDKDSSRIFRAIMKLNTAKTIVMEPGLCQDGIDGYVRNLYKELEINI